MEMFSISLAGMTPLQKAIAQKCFRDDGFLRATRPPLDSFESKCAAYVWRMVVWHISRLNAHQCMPVMAFDYLPEGVSAKSLDCIVDKIVYQIPPSQWAGIAAWSGLIG